MYSEENKKILLELARKSIKHGLENGRSLPVKIKDFDEELHQSRATFVTIKIEGALRGCIGVLEAYRSLCEDVAENAYSAAFRDPRFGPLKDEELDKIEISISVLNPSEPMTFTSEEDLISQIKPGVDGLILEDGMYRGTFLPAVWESVKTAKEFFTHLKLKAGLPSSHWSDTLTVKRYTTEYLE
jgi:uncharacterized protein